MRVHVVDPSAYTPPYDHALCAALAGEGVDVTLVTSPFAYGEVPAPDGYLTRSLFYRHAVGPPGSALRRAVKLAQHGPDMARYRRLAARDADVVHFQWLAAPWLDVHLLPARPLVLTAHDLLPREPRLGQVAAQRRLLARMDAIVVHSQYGRSQLVQRLGVDADRVRVIHHGAFEHLAAATPGELPPELEGAAGEDRPVVLFFGLLRAYKGLATLLEAWRGVEDAQLWIAGRPMMDLAPLRAIATPSVRWITRFVADAEAVALLARADIVVLPYARTERLDQSGVLASALAFGKPVVVTDVGGFGEVAALGAARLVAPDDPPALRAALTELIADGGARARLGEAALAAARGPYSWQRAAGATLALYQELVRR
jgi:glycosyltransferase involved in cell wall biosynthesis